MSLQLVTPPASEPVSLADLKAWTKGDNDAVLTACGIAARQHVEQWIGRQLVTATWRLTLRCFPSGLIVLPMSPLQSIASIVFKDGDGTEQTIDGADYLVGLAAGTVEPVRYWPSAGDYPDAVQVEFVAGYGNAASVPEPIKTAIKIIAGSLAELARAETGIDRETIPDVRSISRSPSLAAVAQQTASRLLGNYRIRA